ncbi:protein DCL homolog, chloroplastic-like [Arachis stenosperma]|uniref:protein DCL homolog, chloroplastic-like n=1 Tax=Arachis stenosperma TaxID=217475 RepID=UPI0025AB69D3|nr:protein DCL homolog, chloroplastic-like [Arachis stenosperma]
MRNSSPFNLLRHFLLHRHLRFTLAPPQHRAWCTAATPTTNPDHLWKEKEEKILRDIEPLVTLTKDILHSPRYKDGAQLTVEDQKIVAEMILPYHPYSEDKIGSGIESIMVDRHPHFRQSRCLFVVRTDGGWVDFSYHKCIQEYIRDKYPTHAERFIQEHFKHRKLIV